ncbi:MAG: TonB-dependent receptor, partial [Pseudomonadota bacterium]
AFTDTEVQKIPTAPEVVGYIPAVVVGGDLYNYSPATHNIGINYDQELGGDWELFVSANYVTRDKPDGVNAFDLTATEFVPAAEKFENLSINIGARRGAWDVAFSVDNVTDFDGMYFPGTSIETAGLIPYPTTYSIQVSYDGMP